MLDDVFQIVLIYQSFVGRNAVVVLIAGLICFGVKGYYGNWHTDLPITPVNYNEGSLPFLHVPDVTWKNIKVQ